MESDKRSQAQYKAEIKKKKGGRTKQPPFYVLCVCVKQRQSSQNNHEGINNNIKPI